MKNFKKIILTELILFLTASLLSIATAHKFYGVIVANNIDAPEIGIWQLIIPIVSVTLSIVFLIRFLKTSKKREIILRAIFVLAVFSGGLITLGAWIGGALPFFIMVFLLLAWFKKPFVLLHDLCLILAVAGSASYLGLSLKPEIISVFLVLFSVYDFIAVYKTKHMVEIAKAMMKSKAILGIIVPPDAAGFLRPLKDISSGNDFLILGGGDMVSPILLCCSLVPLGIAKALVVSAFSLIGIFFSLYIFYKQKRKNPIPALPPIAFFSIIGFLLTRLW